MNFAFENMVRRMVQYARRYGYERMERDWFTAPSLKQEVKRRLGRSD